MGSPLFRKHHYLGLMSSPNKLTSVKGGLVGPSSVLWNQGLHMNASKGQERLPFNHQTTNNLLHPCVTSNSAGLRGAPVCDKGNQKMEPAPACRTVRPHLFAVEGRPPMHSARGRWSVRRGAGSSEPGPPENSPLLSGCTSNACPFLGQPLWAAHKEQGCGVQSSGGCRAALGVGVEDGVVLQAAQI